MLLAVAGDEADEGRTGARPAGGQRAGLDERVEQSGGLGEQGRAGRLVDPVLRGGTDQVRRIGQPRDQQAHATEVEDDVVPAERVGEHSPGFGGGQVALGHQGDEHQVLGERQRRLQRDALDHRGGEEAAEDTGRRVLGVPVVGGRNGEGVVGSRRRRCCRGQRSRGTEAAGDRDLRAHRDGDAIVTQHLGHDAGGQV